MRKKTLLIALVAVFCMFSVAAWFAHKPILARCYVQRLERANEHEVDATIEQIVSLGDVAMPYLVDLLQRDGETASRSGRALGKMLNGIPADDSRRGQWGRTLANAFSAASTDGRQAILELQDPLLSQAGNPEFARATVRAGLKDPSPAIREQAVILAVRTELGLDPEVVPLLRDSHASVRRSAMMAVGSARELVPDDELLPWLHDSDSDVRALCEAALRARGLADSEIFLGRLVTHPDPLRRLEVIDKLPTHSQLDANTWLLRLSQDAMPVVRAGAARAALDPDYRLGIDFTSRVRQMAESDPDGTVRQIAGDLLNAHRARMKINPGPESR